MRISNFLLWQAAYSGFFGDRLWPDFDEACLGRALDSFNRVSAFWQNL